MITIEREERVCSLFGGWLQKVWWMESSLRSQMYGEPKDTEKCGQNHPMSESKGILKGVVALVGWLGGAGVWSCTPKGCGFHLHILRLQVWSLVGESTGGNWCFSHIDASLSPPTHISSLRSINLSSGEGVFFFFKKGPWLVWLSGLGTGLQTKGSPVPHLGHMRGLQARSALVGGLEATTHWYFSLSLSPFPSLKINK